MGPVEALRLALTKEQEAMQMYEHFASEFPSAKDVFIFLINEETKHKLLLEKKIAELTRY